jgi:signal transduction histidine kinase
MPLFNPFVLRRFLLLLLLQSLFYFRGGGQENMMLNTIQQSMLQPADSAAIVGLIGSSQQVVYSDLAQALDIVDSAMKLSRQSNFFYGIGNAYIAYAAYAVTSGNYPGCDSLLRLAYPYCFLASRQASSNNLLVLWFQNKGNLAAYTGDYNQAVAYSFRALQLLHEKIADSAFVTLKITLYNDIGSMLQYLNQPDKAIDYLQKGVDLARIKNQAPCLASLYVNFGNAYRQKEDWVKSRDYLLQAVALCGVHDNPSVLQVAYLSLANGDLSKNQPDSAIVWLRKATAISGNINPYMAQVIPNITLGNIYQDKHDFKQASFYGENALKQGTALHAPQTISMAHQLLSKSYSATGQWEKAYYHQRAFSLLHDSLTDAKKLLEVNQLEVKYRVANKDRQLTEQAFALSRQQNAIREKNFWIAGTAFTAIVLLILLMLIRKNQRSRQKVLAGTLALSRMKAVVEGEEQERRRIARELHDGIASQLLAVKLNLSSSIRNAGQHALQAADVQESVNLLTEAMQDLRDTSHNLTNERFLRMGFQQAVADFCDQIHSSGAIKVVFQSYGKPAETGNALLLSIFRVIQEFIQNALKHAQAHTLLVQLNFQKDVLGITVQDDGRGFRPEQHIALSGSGLNNLQERVQSLNGILEISSDESGTSIYLEFSHLDKPI